MDTHMYLQLCFVALALLFPENIATGRASGTTEVENGVIGAILDCNTDVGKEERVAMEIAIEDFNKQHTQKLILRVKCSRGGPLHAAQAARYIINRIHVQAILGPNSWEESSAAAEIAHQYDLPMLSLSDSSPPWATGHWPFLIQASPNTSKQMNAVAAIIESWKWRRVKVIYEDTESMSYDILNHLYGALGEAEVQVSGLLPLPSFASLGALHEELEKLKREQCRVFIVHTSLGLAERIFWKAMEMKMMEKEYVWITTDSTTSMVHAMNASVISSMQGVVGVRRYFPGTGQDFREFNKKFVASFRHKYGEERSHDPGIFALQAYDATWAVGSAVNAGSKDGQQLLEKIEEMDFNGLSGKFQFQDRKLSPVNQFQVINVIGKSYRELGFWSDGLGFSTVIDNTASYNFSMETLGHVFWPGGPWSTPRGWDLPTITNPLRIGVPNESLINRFVKVEYDPIKNTYIFSGFSIDVFNKTVGRLNYSLPYQFIPFRGKYSDLVKKVRLKEFDAAVGDIAITSSRYNYVEFTHPHTESGLVMVVPILRQSNRAWLFMKPFTKAMWFLTGFINVYNGFVIWSIEKNYSPELKGPFLTQIATLIWLAFATLFSLNGERLHSNLSKMATVVWLFVALIITQSYTACLSSLLTLQNIEPKIANIEILKSQNAYIGYSSVSFVKDYLVGPLKFNENNIKNFSTPDEYASALRSGEISAAFLEVPVAKLFVAKYCRSFTIAGPTYKVGGYGFAFPKGSLLLPDMDKALLGVFESGALVDLENALIASEKCEDIQPDNETESLSPHSFFVLFIFTGGTSTTAIAIYYFRNKWRVENSMAGHKAVWLLISSVLMKWRSQRSRFSRKDSDVESPTDSPNSAHT